MTTDNRWARLAGKYRGKEEIEKCAATRKTSEMRNGEGWGASFRPNFRVARRAAIHVQVPKGDIVCLEQQ